MDELCKQYAKWNTSDTQDKYDTIPLIWSTRTGKFMETERREVTRGWESYYLLGKEFVWGDENILDISEQWWWLYKIVNALNATELYTVWFKW